MKLGLGQTHRWHFEEDWWLYGHTWEKAKLGQAHHANTSLDDSVAGHSNCFRKRLTKQKGRNVLIGSDKYSSLSHGLGPIPLLKQRIMLSTFLLSKNKHDISHSFEHQMLPPTWNLCPAIGGLCMLGLMPGCICICWYNQRKLFRAYEENQILTVWKQFPLDEEMKQGSYLQVINPWCLQTLHFIFK